MKRYVIIGGGVAAVACAEGIRAVDAEGDITLIAAEGRAPYCRPLISYYLQGKTDFERMKYRSDAFYEDIGCALLYDKAARIDAQACAVETEGGLRVPYDALCVATGSSPFVPPMNGLDTVPRVYGFMTEDDALALERALEGAPRVLIVGAGLIGLKCAEGICARAQSVTVCDIASHALSSVMDAPCAERLQKRLEAHGVRFLLSDGVTRFDKDTAAMTSGREVPFDALVLAVGVRPDTALAERAGCAVKRGILVDPGMRTSIPNVYAAGDCAQGLDAMTGERSVLAILPNAVYQGRCAGQNMAGGHETADQAIPMNAIGFFGLHALTAGVREGDLYEETSEHAVKRLYIRDGLLRGFVLIGDVAGAGIYTALIRERTPLHSVDFDMLKRSPSLAAFSPKFRGKTLGGVV